MLPFKTSFSKLAAYRDRCDVALRRSDLRFLDADLEHRFKESLERRLVQSIAVMSTIFCISGLISLWDIRRELEHHFDMSWHDPRTLSVLLYSISCLLVPALTLLLTIKWHCFRRCECVDWELVAVFMPSLMCLLLPWINGWSIAKLYSNDPAEVWIRDMRASEGLIALMLDGITTGLCLFVPIRIHLKLISPVCGCVSFSCSALFLDSPFPEHRVNRIWVLCILTFCALWGAWQNEREHRRGWIAHGNVHRKSQELTQYHIGLSRIMDRLSDCLVYLERSFNILEPTPRLAALLLRTNSDALQGTSFLDYMASKEDQASFSHALHRTTEPVYATDASGGMLHIKLRDACNREFVTYAYYAGIHDSEGDCSYFVALVEAQDRGAPETFKEAVLPVELDPRLDPRLDKHSASFADAIVSCSDSSITASRSGSNLSWPMLEKLDEVAAWIDVGNPDLLIVRCTPGFTVLGPMMVGASLPRMIHGDVDAFTGWLQTCVNLYENEMCAEHHIKPFSLSLETVPGAGFRFSAECMPDFQGSCENASDSGDPDICLIRIVFSNLTTHRCRRKDKHKRRHRRHSRDCPPAARCVLLAL